jgi:hypothetical protein
MMWTGMSCYYFDGELMSDWPLESNMRGKYPGQFDPVKLISAINDAYKS